MSSHTRYWLILVTAAAACVGALVAAIFHRKLAASILGGAKLWQQLVVLAVCGLVVTASYEIGRQAWRLLAKGS